MTHVGGGSEQFSNEDRVYAGSRFRDVVAAVFANPYQQVWGREGEPALPNEVVTFAASSVTCSRVTGIVDSNGRPSGRSTPALICAGVRTGRDSGASCIPTGSASRAAGRSRKTRRTPVTLLATARRSSSPDTRAVRAATSADRSDRSLLSANSFRPRIRTTRSRCGRRTSSRKRTSAARGPSRSTRRSWATRRT